MILAFGPDHDQSSKDSPTPSAVLECDIPELPTGSFYLAVLHMLVKDTILQLSSPARHAAELTALLTAAVHTKPALLAFIDSGSDHSCTYLSVQLAWILLFLQLDLDMIVICHTAPEHSYTNPAEAVGQP